VMAERERMLSFAQSVRSAASRQHEKPFKLVINIGIGGSDLGPLMAVRRWSDYAGAPQSSLFQHRRQHLHDLLDTADPATTLFIVASKTFVTWRR